MTADDLKSAREALGLGPVAMADKLGMTYANYWRLERGAVIRHQIELMVTRLIENHNKDLLT